ncbi:NADH dehydrogenase [Aphelenchoides besseyi]|nr:NADH dehydrogenase [Aphelenchoides besseyi]KAI6228238.1 NADH dehydrogenase [Aphelenchoides besseyi]
MGNLYSQPEKKGNSPFTRSGVPPPPTSHMSDKPHHRVHDPMSLEMHMADQRMRTAGMSDAEREWRHKWLKDQHLHPDEPIHVDAVHRQLNPIRILYRYPLDTLYRRFLQPTFGTYYGSVIRILTPKLIFSLLVIETLYYQTKYNSRGWQQLKGTGTEPIKRVYDSEIEIRKEHPGLFESGIHDPAKYRYFTPDWIKRSSHLELGETARPY